MNITEIINKINSHEELLAESFDDGIIYVEKVTSKRLGNELIGDYIERILGRKLMNHLKVFRIDDAASVVEYSLR